MEKKLATVGTRNTWPLHHPGVLLPADPADAENEFEGRMLYFVHIPADMHTPKATRLDDIDLENPFAVWAAVGLEFWLLVLRSAFLRVDKRGDSSCHEIEAFIEGLRDKDDPELIVEHRLVIVEGKNATETIGHIFAQAWMSPSKVMRWDGTFIDIQIDADGTASVVPGNFGSSGGGNDESGKGGGGSGGGGGGGGRAVPVNIKTSQNAHVYNLYKHVNSKSSLVSLYDLTMRDPRLTRNPESWRSDKPIVDAQHPLHPSGVFNMTKMFARTHQSVHPLQRTMSNYCPPGREGTAALRFPDPSLVFRLLPRMWSVQYVMPKCFPCDQLAADDGAFQVLLRGLARRRDQEAAVAAAAAQQPDEEQLDQLDGPTGKALSASFDPHTRVSSPGADAQSRGVDRLPDGSGSGSGSGSGVRAAVDAIGGSGAADPSGTLAPAPNPARQQAQAEDAVRMTAQRKKARRADLSLLRRRAGALPAIEKLTEEQARDMHDLAGMDDMDMCSDADRLGDRVEELMHKFGVQKSILVASIPEGPELALALNTLDDALFADYRQTCMSGTSDVSRTQQLLNAYFIANDLANLDDSLHITDLELSVANNYMIYLNEAFGVYEDIATNQGYLSRMFVGLGDGFRRAFDLHLHYILYGDGGTGKSKGIYTVFDSMLRPTSTESSTKSRKVESVEKRVTDDFVYTDDGSFMKLYDASQPGQDAELKGQLTSSRFVSQVLEIERTDAGNSRRVVKTFNNITMGCRVIGTNENKLDISKGAKGGISGVEALLSRFDMIEIPDHDFEARNTHNASSVQDGGSKKELRKAFQNANIKFNFVRGHYHKLVSIGVVPDVNMHAFDLLYPRFLAILKARGAPPSNSRVRYSMRLWTRQLAIAATYHTMHTIPSAPFYKKAFEIGQLRHWNPVCTEDHVIQAFGVYMSQFVPDAAATVLDVLSSMLFNGTRAGIAQKAYFPRIGQYNPAGGANEALGKARTDAGKGFRRHGAEDDEDGADPYGDVDARAGARAGVTMPFAAGGKRPREGGAADAADATDASPPAFNHPDSFPRFVPKTAVSATGAAGAPAPVAPPARKRTRMDDGSGGGDGGDGVAAAASGDDQVERDPNWVCLGRRTIEDFARYVAVVSKTGKIKHSEAAILDCLDRWKNTLIKSKPYRFDYARTAAVAAALKNKRRGLTPASAPLSVNGIAIDDEGMMHVPCADGRGERRLPAWAPEVDSVSKERHCEPGIQYRGQLLYINYALLDPTNCHANLMTVVVRESAFEHTLPRRALLGPHPEFPWLYDDVTLAPSPDVQFVVSNPQYIPDHQLVSLTGRNSRSALPPIYNAELIRHNMDIDTMCFVNHYSSSPRGRMLSIEQMTAYHPRTIRRELERFYASYARRLRAAGETVADHICFVRYPAKAIADQRRIETNAERIADPVHMRQNAANIKDSLAISATGCAALRTDVARHLAAMKEASGAPASDLYLADDNAAAPAAPAPAIAGDEEEEEAAAGGARKAAGMGVVPYTSMCPQARRARKTSKKLAAIHRTIAANEQTLAANDPVGMAKQVGRALPPDAAAALVASIDKMAKHADRFLAPPPAPPPPPPSPPLSAAPALLGAAAPDRHLGSMLGGVFDTNGGGM